MEVDVVKKKIKSNKKKKNIYIYREDGTVEQIQPEARCNVQHSGFKETSKG